MSDGKDPNETKKPSKLSLKIDPKNLGSRKAGGAGRSKTVIIEVKRRSRTAAPTPKVERVAPKPAPVEKKIEQKPEAVQQPAKMPSGLSQEERQARLDALEKASKFVQKQEERQEEQTRRQAEIRKVREEKHEEEREREEELRKEEERKQEKQRLKEEAFNQANQDPAEVNEGKHGRPKKHDHAPKKEEEATDQKKRQTPAYEVKKVAVDRRQGRRSMGKMSMQEALDGESGQRTRSLSAIKRAREKEKKKLQEHFQPLEKISHEVTIPDVISVQELASRMAERGAEVIKCLMKLGIMATITQVIDADTAQLVAEELGHRVKRVSESDFEDSLLGQEDDPKDLKPRAPVVTIMGHVDHGKTSLLDALRSTDVVGGEAGGITQHIGAYQVALKSGEKITFIDTPGHAAFTEMRSRGAHVTDIVVLVVAADDGLKEQTIEAINHARAAEVPIIVAINKMDKPEANPSRVKNELLSQELVVEEMGGDILAIEVSATEKTNLDKLGEAILLQAEMLDLKANPNRCAVGVVVEAKIEKGRGPVATVLIQKGTLRTGDIFVAGTEYGKVRALINDKGSRVNEAIPGVPVEVLGFNAAPLAGDVLSVVEEEFQAREIAEKRYIKKREKEFAREASTAENLFAQAGDIEELPVVIKADVQGSAEAISSSLQKLSTDEVRVRVLHCGVGGINETDITLASASRALVIGFNVRANAQAREHAKHDGVDIRYYSIIYDVVNDAKALMGGLLSPIAQEDFIGRAVVRQTFKVPKIGIVAGCYVENGFVKRGSKVRILRDDVVIHEGPLKTLKRVKDEVKEVKNGLECGMAFENYQDIREGDIIECAEVTQVARTL